MTTRPTQPVRHHGTDPRPFHELVDSGLLWLINTTVFHPRGLALAVTSTSETGDPATGWVLDAATPGEPFTFPDHPAVADRYRSAHATIEGARGGASALERFARLIGCDCAPGSCFGADENGDQGTCQACADLAVCPVANTDATAGAPRDGGNPAEADDPLWSDLFDVVSREVELPDGVRLLLKPDQADGNGRWYYQLEVDRADTYTGVMGVGRSGRAYLDPTAAHGELVQTVFSLLLRYVEHEAREAFQWRGRRVFGPHIATEALWDAAQHTEARP